MSLYIVMEWRRQWHPTPVLLPGKSHGRRAWWAVVHGVAKSRTRLSDFTFTFTFHIVKDEIQLSVILQKRNHCALLMRKWIGTDNMEDSVEVIIKKIELPYNPEIPPLDIYLKKAKLIWRYMHPIFIEAFTIDKLWKQPKCPSTGKWIEKMWDTHTHTQMFSSVEFSCSVVSDSLWTHESQHTRPPCPCSHKKE